MLKNKMSGEASVNNNIHIGPVINLNSAGQVENNETFNVICCSCTKEEEIKHDLKGNFLIFLFIPLNCVLLILRYRRQ